MKDHDLNLISLDDLWELHESVVDELNRKIAAERAKLENRLRQLSPAVGSQASKSKRAYPEVLPKYRNPKNGGQTWAGRGKQPRWLADQLRSGKKLEDFLIRKA
jgi:DNA-binding protein H-NS